MKFIVSYTLPYVHRVMVGIEADTEETAIARADAYFNEGSLWDDTPRLPLLFDDFEEQGDSGDVLEFTIEQTLAEGEAYPAPDASVVAIRRGNAARRAAEMLVAAYRRGEGTGSVDWEDLNLAYETALLAVD